MERITLVIDGTGFVLGDGSDVTELKDRIAHAARTGPAFVDFTTVGGTASALIGTETRVVLTTEAVPEAVSEAVPTAQFETEVPYDAWPAWSLDFAVDASFGWDEPFQPEAPEIPRLRALGGRE